MRFDKQNNAFENETVWFIEDVCGCCVQTTSTKGGMLNSQDEVLTFYAKIPGLKPGIYNVTIGITEAGVTVDVFELDHGNRSFLQMPVFPISTNLAFAIKRIGHANGETGRLR